MERKRIEISRDADGPRFIGEYVPEKGFVDGDILCVGCGRRIDLQPREISLACQAAGKARSFWSEADLHVYLAEHWGHLRIVQRLEKLTQYRICHSRYLKEMQGFAQEVQLDINNLLVGSLHSDERGRLESLWQGSLAVEKRIKEPTLQSSSENTNSTLASNRPA